jgi:hypothetical protein
MDVVAITSGSVVYSLYEAAVGIDEMISALIEAKDDGATHVVGLSGNDRGARYVHLSTEPEWL